MYNIFCFFIFLQDEYNLNPGLEWEDEFTGRYISNKRQEKEKQ